MLYIYYGTDIDSVHAKARKLIDSLQAKKPDAAYYALEADNLSTSILDELTESQGLFEKKYIVYINQGFGGSDSGDILTNYVERLRDSENVFVLVEHALTAPIKKKLEKAAHKMQESALKDAVGTQVKGKGGFKLFSLSDAYGERNKKRLWVLLQEAYRNNLSPEEIHGNLAWQTRMMLLATQTASGAEADIKPFVYNKAKGYAKNFTDKELTVLSKRLVDIYHNARRGKGELATTLEQFVLQL